MSIEQPIISSAGKGVASAGNFLFLPTGKLNLIITGVVFLILAFVGLSESFQQHSGYPFFEKTLLPIVGADTSISIMVDDLNANPTPIFDGFLTKTFPAYLWFYLKFWFLILCNCWFIFFFIWLLYNLFALGNSSLIARNILLAIGSFILISLFVGMVMYNVRLSGMCLPEDKTKNFNHLLANTYPLNGVSKLAVRFINHDTFNRIAVWSNSGFGKMVTNIPKSPDLLNETNVSVS